MSDGPVVVTRDGDVAVVTLSSPPVNLWTEAVIEGYESALDALEADPPRAALLRAEGRVVSGGVDVNLFATVADGAAGGVLWERLLRLPARLEALPYPTVFAAHALCLTASFELSLACDLLLAAEGAKFGLVERVVGLTPSMGGPQRLVERAGPARARELVYTGALYDAATLERWNVVNRVLATEGFDDAARAFTRDLAAGPTVAHAATKRLVRAALEGGAPAADAIVPEVAGSLFDTNDLKNAVRSFLEHGPGKATFNGT
ncbi:MAG: enoyl-CoA hydratase [Solirubrobacteraceae bacterium]|nr:enoyl-CoA hydratase [Solirubrobacteraceae bacterium]